MQENPASAQSSGDSTSHLSALKREIAQLAGQLADAQAAGAEKDSLVARLNRQLEHSVDEWTRLEELAEEREERIRTLQTDVAKYAGQALDAARELGDLEGQVKDLEQKLAAIQDRRAQAQRAIDVQMKHLFLEVVKLGEPENKNVQQAIADATTFLNGDASPVDKAARAYKTLERVVRNMGAEARAFGVMAKTWMTKDIEDAHAKMNVIKRYPKALDQIDGWMKECWPKVECHFGHLYTLREQIALEAELAEQAGLSAYIALRQERGTLAIYSCFKTAYQAFAVVTELNRKAVNASIDLEADLTRTTQAVETVLKAHGKLDASLDLTSLLSDEADDSSSAEPSAPAVHDLPQDYATQEETRWWDDSSTSSYQDYSTNEVIYNPANGMPMNGGYGGVDVMGNPYGFDSY